MELIIRKSSVALKKTPILFVHGAWHGSWCWEQGFTDEFLQNGHDCYLINFTGHEADKSIRKNIKWKSISDYVSELSDAISQINEPPIIIGHSMGGFIAQKYLETHHAKGCVLLASAPPWGSRNSVLRLMRNSPKLFIDTFLLTKVYKFISAPEEVYISLFDSQISKDQFEYYNTLLCDESYRVFLDILFLNLIRPSKIKTPFLVMAGDKDSWFTKSETTKIAEIYKTSPIIYEGKPHDLMLSPKYEDVVSDILNWVNKR